MGIAKALGVLGRAVKKTAHEMRQETAEQREQEERRTVILNGKTSSEVYVYIPKALSGISKGDEFALVCSEKPMRMKSTVTGTVWDSAENGDVPLLYKGRPIGFLSGHTVCQSIQRAMDAGLHVIVTAVCKAEGKRRGWPTITVHTPSSTQIEKLANERLSSLGMRQIPSRKSR